MFGQTEYKHLLPYIIAQAKLESANFTSDLFKKENNMFGMNEVKDRQTTQIGRSSKQYEGMWKGKYFNLSKSALDQLLYLRSTKFPANEQSLMTFAENMKQRGYFTGDSTKYYNALNSWM